MREARYATDHWRDHGKQAASFDQPVDLRCIAFIGSFLEDVGGKGMPDGKRECVERNDLARGHAVVLAFHIFDPEIPFPKRVVFGIVGKLARNHQLVAGQRDKIGGRPGNDVDGWLARASG